MNEAKQAFMNIKTPEEFMAFKEAYPGTIMDMDMALHLNKIAIECSNGETWDNHSDPRQAFTQK